MSGLDWPGLMQAGLQGLRLEPGVFWALTPAELQVMLGPAQSVAPLLQTRLDSLMAEWPDQAKDESNDRLLG